MTPQAHQRQAAGYLILATAFWGCSFTWTKVIVPVINGHLGQAHDSPVGPTVLTGVRFTLAAIAWFAIFPNARRGWTLRGVGYGLILGLLMAAGMLLQTIGLGRTSVAVSSFLTSLTVLFVPLISILIHLKLPSPILSAGVLLATAGIWLLTMDPSQGLGFTGFGVGEMLGLSCSAVFSVHILAINGLLPRDNVMRLTGMMFLSCGLLCLAATPLMGASLSPAFLADVRVLPRVLMLIFVCTIGAFGLQLTFQPRLNPTRAALLYLFEPIFAAIYAYVEIREKLTLTQFSGAALIIVANALVELLSAWGKKEETQKVALP